MTYVHSELEVHREERAVVLSVVIRRKIVITKEAG